MSDLVQRLSSGDHPVEASLRPSRTVQALKECIASGYVHVRFTKTRGGTELGFPLDPVRSDYSAADFQNQTGKVLLVGELTLDYSRVRCVTHIDLPSLEGVGHLEPIPDSTAERPQGVQ